MDISFQIGAFLISDQLNSRECELRYFIFDKAI